MGSFDVGIWVGLGLTALMTGFVVAFYLLRDREAPTERRLRAWVLCPVDQSPAFVTIAETRHSGLPTRRVEQCSIRTASRVCREQCAWKIRT